jgi:hypothetical protein
MFENQKYTNEWKENEKRCIQQQNINNGDNTRPKIHDEKESGKKIFFPFFHLIVYDIKFLPFAVPCSQSQ